MAQRVFAVLGELSKVEQARTPVQEQCEQCEQIEREHCKWFEQVDDGLKDVMK